MECEQIKKRMKPSFRGKGRLSAAVGETSRTAIARQIGRYLVRFCTRPLIGSRVFVPRLVIAFLCLHRGKEGELRGRHGRDGERHLSTPPSLRNGPCAWKKGKRGQRCLLARAKMNRSHLTVGSIRCGDPCPGLRRIPRVSLASSAPGAAAVLETARASIFRPEARAAARRLRWLLACDQRARFHTFSVLAVLLNVDTRRLE